MVSRPFRWAMALTNSAAPTVAASPSSSLFPAQAPGYKPLPGGSLPCFLSIASQAERCRCPPGRKEMLTPLNLRPATCAFCAGKPTQELKLEDRGEAPPPMHSKPGIAVDRVVWDSS